MQAEIEKGRTDAVQFTFRSTYNLIYKVVCRPAEDVTFCEDSDAYVANLAFNKCCSNFIQMFTNAKKRRYGIREEMRGSGAAILKVLQYAGLHIYIPPPTHLLTVLPGQTIHGLWNHPLDQVRHLVLICQLLDRGATVTAALQCQMAVSECWLLTCLIMHLFYCMATTPKKPLTSLNLTLINLQFESTCEQFGIFFLHDLVWVAAYLPAIELEDDDYVQTALSLTRKTLWQHQAPSLALPLSR